MLNLLRFIVIIVTALVVFGWSMVAAQSIPQLEVAVPIHIPWSDVEGVKLEGLPEIPTDSAQPPKTKPSILPNARSGSGPYLDSLPGLPQKRLTLQQRPVRNWLVVDDGPRASELTLRSIRHANEVLPTRPSEQVLAWHSAAPATRLALSPESAAETAAAAPLADPVGHGAEIRAVSIRPSLPALNYRLLLQRVEAHNLSIVAIETRLQAEQDWNLARIESVVSQLEEVKRSQETWALYWQILLPHQRQQLGSVAPLLPSLTKLRQRIFEAQVAADVDAEQLSLRDKQIAKQRLTQFDRQVLHWLESRD